VDPAGAQAPEVLDSNSRQARGWRRGSARFGELHPRRFFLETWATVDREAAEARRAHDRYDFRPLAALVVGALCLTGMEYLGSGYQLGDLLFTGFERALRIFGGASEEEAVLGASDRLWSLRASRLWGLYEFAYWAAWRVLAYFIVPAILITRVFREPLSAYGLRLKGLREHAWIYGVCVLAVLPLVVAASFRADFASYYPFYKNAGRSWVELVAWELMYALQFVALEFFFRGFWLFACKRAMGSYALAATLVPYCMIHFGKPWAEALGALVAGVVLGTLALRTRSIWSGAFIHVTVAVGMDIAALLQTGGLPRTAWI
jgi:membrane protease YdiL (CAAX protease family)